jgi:GAF domain-containing protein
MTLEAVQRMALDLAWELRLASAARLVTRALVACTDVALARLWLMGPDGLRLASSAGASREPGADWSRLDGAFARVPLGTGKVGRVGGSGTAVLLHDMSARSHWIADPAWAEREGIRAFAAQPVMAGTDVLGVLAIFRRSRIDAGAFEALRRIAAHVAAAVVRARAFEDAERRRVAAEREGLALRAELRRRAAGEGGGMPDAPVLSIGEWREQERANLEAALRRSGGRIYGKDGAAAILGVPPTTLASRLRALGVTPLGRRLFGPS